MTAFTLADVLAIRAMEHDERHYIHCPAIDDALDRGVSDSALLAARARKYFETRHGGSDTLLAWVALSVRQSRTVLIIASLVLGSLFGLSADWLGSNSSDAISVKRYAGIILVSFVFAFYSCVCLLWLWFDLFIGRRSSNVLLQLVEWVAELTFATLRKLSLWIRGTTAPGTVTAVDAITRPLYRFRSTAVFLSRLGCLFTIASLITAGLSAFAMSIFSKPDYVWLSLIGSESQRSWLDYFPPVRIFSDPPTPAIMQYLHGDRDAELASTQRLAFTWMLVDVWLLILAVKLLFLLFYWLTEQAIPCELNVKLNSKWDPYPKEVIAAMRNRGLIVSRADAAPLVVTGELSAAPDEIRIPVAVSPIDESSPACVVGWFNGRIPATFQSAFEGTDFISDGVRFYSLTGTDTREDFLRSGWQSAVVGFKATLAPAQKEVSFLRELLTKSECVTLVLGDLYALRENAQRDAAKVRARLEDWRSKIAMAGWPAEAVIEYDHDAATADSLAQFHLALKARWQRNSITPVVGLHRSGRFDRAAFVLRQGLTDRIREPQREVEWLKQTHDAIREVYQRSTKLNFAELLKQSLPASSEEASAAVRSSLKSLESKIGSTVKPEWLEMIARAGTTFTKFQTHGRSLAFWGVASGVLVAATTLTGGAALLPATLLPVVANIATVAGIGSGLSAALLRLKLVSLTPAIPELTTTVDEGIDPFFRGLVLWSLLLELAGSSESALLEELPKLLDSVGDAPVQTFDAADAALKALTNQLYQ